MLERAVGPLAGIEVSTERLVERTDEIRAARERLAQRMQAAEADSSRAQSIGMYQ